ncbi:GntR family transcriptional regulator [Leifsonia sp. H3M29-4]|uniref:GntR family transcriptional regulator n=1 Tax=Salinibacterium metalliresistens TaxID=3031321 RepID=UPI0023DBCB5F|nr:GntR family transcriptional regulator [Salinibacterium metalliresistens]MDF1480365.1 GntR family transcriptional regulator [Salinibacterium metalliresistens]
MSAPTESSRTLGQLSDRASRHIRELIISGGLAPGTTVRPEIIGEQLHISATPAREALQMLRAEGFLDLAPGRGFSVSPLSGDDIRDLFVMQSLVAGELAARAAGRWTADELQELQALHHELIAAAARSDTSNLEIKNHAFHRQINQMAKSRKMLRALSLSTRYVPREFYGSIPGWPDATVEDHGAILAAIVERDDERARSAMGEHIIHAGELLAQHFDTRLNKGDTP